MAWFNALLALAVQYWPLVFTLILPFVANWLADCKATGAQRGWIAAVISVLVGVAAPLAAGIHLTPANLSVFTAAVFAGATTAYHIFKRIGITNRWLDAALKSGAPAKK